MNPKMSANFEKLLDYPMAQIAFKTLVRRNADPGTLECSLTLFAIFGDVKSDIPWLPPRKITDSASAAMRALARQIRDLRNYMGASAALHEAALSTNIHQAGSRIEMAGLSELLIKYAEALDRNAEKRRDPARISNDAVCRFLDHIRNTTGKNHYSQAALLLNAVYYQYDKRAPRYGSNDLKQLLYRERLRRRNARRPKGIVELVIE
jgi:hypothetical protein